MLALNKNNLLIADCASKDNGRYILQSVRIEKHRTIATDGRIIIRMSTPKLDKEEIPEITGIEKSNTEIKSFLLPANECLKIAKSVPKVKSLPILNHIFVDAKKTNQNGFAVLGQTDLDTSPVYQVRKIEGDYPDVNKVSPKDPVLTIRFNPEFLVRVLKHAQRVNEATVDLKFYGPDKPVSITSVSEDGQTMRALVMPKHR
jgi:DNA polymerase III sliding clamp (beta) subunit (PCNA family)